MIHSFLSRRTPLRRKGSIYERRARTKRDPLDVLWSKVIRTRDPICRLQFRCRGDRTKEAAHIFGRVKGGTKYDLDNGLGACWACHDWADKHKTELEARALELLGAERYTRILVRSNLTAREAGVDRVAVRLYLKQQIKEVAR